MKRKSFITTTASLVMSQGFSFGASESSKAPHLSIAEKAKQKGKGKTLKLLYPKGSLENLSPIARLFKDLSGIEIKLIEAPLDEINTLMLINSLESGDSYDIALPATFGLPDLIEANAIHKLNDLAKEHECKSVKTGSLYRRGDVYKGDLYGYQTDGDTYLLFFNRPWLENREEAKKYEDQFSKKLEIPKTWEDLGQQIKFFHRPDQGQYGGTLFRNSTYLAWEWWIRFHGKGFYPFDKNFKPQINHEAGVKALRELIDITPYLHPMS